MVAPQGCEEILGHSHLSPGLSLTRQLLRETTPGSFCAALGMGRPWSSMSWKERRFGLWLESPPNQGRVPWRFPQGCARVAQGVGPDHVLEQNLSPLRLWLLQGCPKEGAPVTVRLSAVQQPMSVLHGAPVAMPLSESALHGMLPCCQPCFSIPTTPPG